MSSFLYRSSERRKLFNAPIPRVKEERQNVAPVLTSIQETLDGKFLTPKKVMVIIVVAIVVLTLITVLLL